MDSCTDMRTVFFAVKRLDRCEEEPSSIISLNIGVDDKVSDVAPLVRDKLGINSHETILRLRNYRGSIIPMNGRVTELANTHSRPHVLEVVHHFQSVQPNPLSIELSQYTEPLTRKLHDIQDRITLLEDSIENMHDNRKEKVNQEMIKLETTVSFLKKRIEEAETIEWNGMFVKNPLW